MEFVVYKIVFKLLFVCFCIEVRKINRRFYSTFIYSIFLRL
jgi:hypothetical protein